MDVYLGYVQKVANRLSVDSLADMTLNWMHSKKMLENPTTAAILSGFNEASIDAVIQIISRVVCAHFIYPRVSPIFSLINASIGIVHLGIGFTERFKTLENPSQNPKEWNTIAKNVHKGFCHLLCAGYDFGIGFLLQQKYFDAAGVLVFAAMPVIVLVYHRTVFKKLEDKLPLPTTVQSVNQNVVTEMVVDIAKAKVTNAVLGTIPKPSAQNTQETPPLPAPEKVTSNYLDSTCYIYILAEKITLELMPSIQQQDGLLFRRA